MALPLADVLVIIVAVVAFVLFVTEWLPPAATAIGVAAALMVAGVVTPAEGLSGFSNEATVTVLCMLALAGAVQKTGLVNMAAHRLLEFAHGSAARFRGVLLVMAGLVSSVLNNTAVVAVMTPVASTAAGRLGRHPSQFLLPMAYASTLGGMLTLVGTSTTVLASSLWAGMGQPGFHMFQFTHIGLAVFVVGVAFLLVASRLLPGRPTTPASQANGYVFEIRVPPDSGLIGQQPASCDLVQRYGMLVLQVTRGSRRVEAPIEAGDVLAVQGGREDILKLRDIEKIQLRPEAEHWLPGTTVVAEAVVTPGSLLDGRSLEDVRFRGRYDAVVLAVRRRRAPVRRLAGTQLVGGDVLLVRGTPAAIRAMEEEMHLVVPAELEGVGFRTKRIPHVLVIVAAVVGSAALGLVPLVVAALAGVVAAVATGCLRLHEFQTAVRWDVVLLIAGLIPLGIALEKTGTAAQLAAAIARIVEPWPPLAIVVLLYLVTMVLTEVMSNNATVVLMLPLGVQVAHAAGLAPLPVVVAITFAASLAFMTPIGYQTHMMVYGPGEYRFADYLRLGTALNLVCGAIAILLIQWTWPLR